MILIHITADMVEALIKCRHTTKRGFNGWNIESLLQEAVFEFEKKYGGKKT